MTVYRRTKVKIQVEYLVWVFFCFLQFMRGQFALGKNPTVGTHPSLSLLLNTHALLMEMNNFT